MDDRTENLVFQIEAHFIAGLERAGFTADQIAAVLRIRGEAVHRALVEFLAKPE